MVSLQDVGGGFVSFFQDLSANLRNFHTLTLGEQVSYLAIGVGLILIVVALILFVV